MARANDTGTTIILFSRAHARPKPKPPRPRTHLVHILDQDGDAVAFQLRLEKQALRGILTHVLEEDDDTMLISANIPKSALVAYAPLFAVLLSFGEAR